MQLSTALLCVVCAGLAYALGLMTTRSVLKAGEAMIQAAEKLAGIPEMTLAARRLLKLLAEQEKFQREWVSKIETMDRNQGALLNAMNRMGAIRVLPPDSVQPGGLIVGSRPGLDDAPGTPPRTKSGSDKHDAHI